MNSQQNVFNVNGLVIDDADTGRPTLRALYDDEQGREATVGELAFWREAVRLHNLLETLTDPDLWSGAIPARLEEFRVP